MKVLDPMFSVAELYRAPPAMHTIIGTCERMHDPSCKQRPKLTGSDSTNDLRVYSYKFTAYQGLYLGFTTPTLRIKVSQIGAITFQLLSFE